MLLCFSASGHNNYTKSCMIYLDEIAKRKGQFPHIHDNFSGKCMLLDAVTDSSLDYELISLLIKFSGDQSKPGVD